MEKNRKSKTYWITFTLIIFFFGAMVIYLTTITPAIQGDGYEYIIQTAAFQNHFSFGINEDDLEKAKEQFYNNQETIQWVYDNNLTFDKRGWKYSNHFGAYSALVTFVKLFLLQLNLYPVWAFSITNLLLWMAAVLTAFFFLDVNDKERFCIVFLLLFNPIFFYLDWVHTEMYIFAFEVIGLVFLYNKKYALSILSFSVSAMQNIGVFPMAAVAGVAYILDCYDEYVTEKKNKNIFQFAKLYWKKIIPYGVFYIPALLPVITTYLRFGTYNLVAKVAMEKKYMLHKAVDYLFDLNLGVFPYEPIILIAFLIFIIIGLKKFTRKAFLNLIGVIGILYIISHQYQINSGMQEIMRYCVWIIPVMIFYVVLEWRHIKKNNVGLMPVSIAEGVFTAALVSYCVWFGGGYTSGQFAKWTKILLDLAPQAYNPTHGIFYSRIGGGERYYSPTPMVYTNDEGYVRKILLSQQAESRFFSEWFRLIDEEGNIVDKTKLRGHKIDEGDFTYYNFTGQLRHQEPIVGETIDVICFYPEDYNADKYVQRGITENESWGCWIGKELKLSFNVDEDIPFVDMYFNVENVFYPPQSVTVLINGEEVYQVMVEGRNDIEFVFKNPGTNYLELTMLLPDAVAPSEIADSEINDILGIALKSINISAADFIE